MASNGRRPNASPHSETGSSSGYASGSSPSHLRNRSQGGTHDPFDDRNAASGRSSPPLVPMPPLAQPTPHRAALMMAASQSQSSLAHGSETEQAMNVRGPRAEWVSFFPFVQLLRDESNSKLHAKKVLSRRHLLNNISTLRLLQLTAMELWRLQRSATVASEDHQRLQFSILPFTALLPVLPKITLLDSTSLLIPKTSSLRQRPIPKQTTTCMIRERR